MASNSSGVLFGESTHSRNAGPPLITSIASLPIYIFSSLGLGDENATTRAWGGSLVLLGVVFILFAIARTLSTRIARK
jgi:ABC-type phosphate transport system permease subunit